MKEHLKNLPKNLELEKLKCEGGKCQFTWVAKNEDGSKRALNSQEREAVDAYYNSVKEGVRQRQLETERERLVTQKKAALAVDAANYMIKGLSDVKQNGSKKELRIDSDGDGVDDTKVTVDENGKSSYSQIHPDGNLVTPSYNNGQSSIVAEENFDGGTHYYMDNDSDGLVDEQVTRLNDGTFQSAPMDEVIHGIGEGFIEESPNEFEKIANSNDYSSLYDENSKFINADQVKGKTPPKTTSLEVGPYSGATSKTAISSEDLNKLQSIELDNATTQSGQDVGNNLINSTVKKVVNATADVLEIKNLQGSTKAALAGYTSEFTKAAPVLSAGMKALKNPDDKNATGNYVASYFGYLHSYSGAPGSGSISNYPKTLNSIWNTTFCNLNNTLDGNYEKVTGIEGYYPALAKWFMSFLW